MLDALSPRITDAFDVVTFDARGVGLSDGRDCPRASSDYDAGADDARLRQGAGHRLHPRGRTPRTSTCIATRPCRWSRTSRRSASGSASTGSRSTARATARSSPRRTPPRTPIASTGSSWTPRSTVSWRRRRCGRSRPTGSRPSVAATLALVRAGRGLSRRHAGSRRRPTTGCSTRSDDGDLSASITGPDGGASTLTLSRAQFDTVTDSAMYDPMSRMAWLRALAAFDRGDRRKLVHLYDAWVGAGLSSTFAYFATWCADVRASPTARDDDYDAYISELRHDGAGDPGSLDIATAIVPCVFWPAQPTTWAPPAEATTVPTLILTTTDRPDHAGVGGEGHHGPPAARAADRDARRAATARSATRAPTPGWPTSSSTASCRSARRASATGPSRTPFIPLAALARDRRGGRRARA